VNTNGIVVARYNYDPYGNLLGMSGPLAEANVYRFSSKEWCANAGLYYYGFRFYEPNLQRWLNRDPIGERGGINMYGFVKNNAVNLIDLWGLEVCIYDEHGGSKADQHRWVEIHREGLVAAFGFYPTGAGLPGALGSPGQIQIPDPHAFDTNKISRHTYHTTPAEEAALLQWMLNQRPSPGHYAWPSSQCRTFTDKVEKKLKDEFKVPPSKDQPNILNPQIGHRTEEDMLKDIKTFIEKYLPKTPEAK